MKQVYLLFFLISIVLVSCDNKKFTEQEERTFHIDANQVDEIFLSDTQKKNSHLVKKGDKWLLNGVYTARPDLIAKLLETMEFVKYRNPVPQKTHDQVVKNLIGQHTKVEIFSKGKAIMAYFVGGQTQDGLGSYMLRQNIETQENADHVFITEIPGFHGYISSRYIADPSLWRDRTVFSYSKDELKSIKIEYPQVPNESFEIILNDDHSFTVLNTNQEEVLDFDPIKVKKYLINYKEVNFESMATKDMSRQLDSLQLATPFYVITATDKDGNSNKVEAHRRKPLKEEFDINGDPMEYDTDRLFSIINDEPELIIIQYFVFDHLTASLTSLLQDPS